MKQYILIKLDSLSEKASKKLVNWCNKHKYQCCGSFGGGFVENDIYYELSIGQMIEFLDKHMKPFTFTVGIPTMTISQKKIELCDVLWKAVEEVLEK